MTKHNQIKRFGFAIISIVLWVFLWYYPWGTLFSGIRWIQVAVGILLFIIPGSSITVMLSRKSSDWSGIILYGFVISITLVSFLGIIARVLELSFDFIYNGLFIISTFSLCYIYIRWKPSFSINRSDWKKTLWIIILLIPLSVSIYTAAKLSIPPLIHDDDLSYNALLAYYRYADVLDFTDTVTHITRVRFWLAFWPLAEAVIAQLSGIHGLLLTGVYLSPFLALLSFLSVYHLGLKLNIKKKFIYVGIVAQITSLIRLTGSSQPGVAFFNIFTQDKNVALFIITSIVFALIIDYLNSPSRMVAIILVLSVLGLGFTHPTVLGMTVLVSSVYSFINLIITRQWKPTLILIILLGTLLIPHFSLRFFEDPDRRVYTVESDVDTVRNYKINPHRIRVLADTQYYGIAPEVIDGLPFTLLIFIGLFSLTKIRSSIAARYFVTILVVLGIILFPYTGWLLGLAITPFHLWRIPRLFPFGLSMAYLLEWVIGQFIERIKHLKNYKVELNYTASLLSSIVLLLGAFYILPWAKGNLGGTKPGFDRWYEQYIEIGDFLNTLDDTDVVVVGGPDTLTNDIIPSLAVGANLVSFRNENPGPNTDRWKSIMDEDTIPEERLASLEKLNVKYIILREGPSWMEEIQERHPEKFKLQLENKKLTLYEFNP